jgi:hypothetical protein
LAQATLEGSVLRTNISEQAYALVEHGISSDLIDELVNAYATFTDSEEYSTPDLETINSMLNTFDKEGEIDLDVLDYHRDTNFEWHKYKTNHPQHAKPGGYTNRSLQVEALRAFGRDISPKTGLPLEDDPKEFYHYHPDGTEVMSNIHKKYGWGSIPPEVLELHARFSPIHQLARQAITETFRILEDDCPELINKYVRPEDLDNSPLRLIFYHDGQGDVLAAEHRDKSTMTMQIAESHMGLRVRNPETREMQLVRRSAKEGVLFPGLLYPTMHKEVGTALPPTYHDVINLDESNDSRALHGRNCARWALIWFTNAELFRIPEKHETHHKQAG